MNTIQVNSNFTKIKNAFKNMKHDHTSLEKKFTSLEKEFDDYLTLGKSKFLKLENRIKQLEVTLEANLTDTSLEKKIDDVHRKMEKREQDIKCLNETVSEKILMLEEDNKRNVKYIKKLENRLNLLVGTGRARRCSERLRNKTNKEKGYMKKGLDRRRVGDKDSR